MLIGEANRKVGFVNRFGGRCCAAARVEAGTAARSRRYFLRVLCGELFGEFVAQIELEHAGDIHDQFRPVSVLEPGELESRRLADEEAATLAVLVLGDPLAAAVLTKEEQAVAGPFEEKFSFWRMARLRRIPFPVPGDRRPSMVRTGLLLDVLAVTKLRVARTISGGRGDVSRAQRSISAAK